LDEALKLNELNLAIQEKILGREHPNMAMTMNNIATILGNKGEYEKALEMYKEVLVIREKVLGNDNPRTKVTRRNIANRIRAIRINNKQSNRRRLVIIIIIIIIMIIIIWKGSAINNKQTEL